VVLQAQKQSFAERTAEGTTRLKKKRGLQQIKKKGKMGEEWKKENI